MVSARGIVGVAENSGKFMPIGDDGEKEDVLLDTANGVESVVLSAFPQAASKNPRERQPIKPRFITATRG